LFSNSKKKTRRSFPGVKSAPASVLGVAHGLRQYDSIATWSQYQSTLFLSLITELLMHENIICASAACSLIRKRSFWVWDHMIQIGTQQALANHGL
jgi:hypothetical protein